jgi:hypothetical protein
LEISYGKRQTFCEELVAYFLCYDIDRIEKAKLGGGGGAHVDNSGGLVRLITLKNCVGRHRQKDRHRRIQRQKGDTISLLLFLFKIRKVGQTSNKGTTMRKIVFIISEKFFISFF